MSNKLKALGLGLLAMMALSVVTAINASANGEGHFVSSEAHTEVKGSENALHFIAFIWHGLEGEVVCNKTSFTATTTNLTESDLTFTPSYEGCVTSGTTTSVPIDVNGCTYTFTVAKATTNETQQTLHLICPTGKSIEFTHPNCTSKLPPQTETGPTYTRVEEGGRHYITLIFWIRFNINYESGLCVFLGTNHTFTIHGAITLKGFATAGEQVNLTAT